MTDTTPALDDVGAALTARLVARAATRGVGAARQGAASRAWARSRDDSGAPGASPRRARLLSRVMEGFGTALPAWDRWGQTRGATVLRVLGEAYMLSPDGFVWVVPQAEDAPEEANAVSGWSRAPRRAGRPSASVGRPSTKRPAPGARAAREVHEPEPVLLGRPLEASDRTAALSQTQAGSFVPRAEPSMPPRARRRGRAVARAAARAVPSRGVGRARPLSTGIGRSSARGPLASDEPSVGWAPIAAAHARLDAPETVRRVLPGAADPVWLTGPEHDGEALSVTRLARWGTPPHGATAATGATRARPGSSSTFAGGARRPAAFGDDGFGDTFELAREASEQAAQAAARPLARAARRSESEARADDGLAARSILPRAAGVRGSMGGLAAPRTRPSRATDVALIGLDGAGMVGEAGESNPSSPQAAGGVRARLFGSEGRAGSTPAARAELRPRSAERVAPEGVGAGASAEPTLAPVSATTRALERATRADASRAAEVPTTSSSTALAAPPMSWIRPEVGASTVAGSAPIAGRDARPGPVGHAQRRAEAGPAFGFFAATGALPAAGGVAPDAFADAVRARHEALAPVRGASRALRAPEPSLLDGALTGGAISDDASAQASFDSGASSSIASATARRAGRARPTTRLRDRGASPVEHRAADASRGLEGPLMTLAEVSSPQAWDDVAVTPSSSARGGHVGIAAWRRALSSAPKDVAAALASSPELGAKVVAAMRQMKALPSDEAKPLHARTTAPSGVTAPSKQQEARREKTAAALATLRGSPMRTRADRPNQTRLTRLASKLEGLVHLVESEQREADAQRWVRRASEPAEAAGASTAAAAAGAQDMSLDTLQREVLEAVLRELERAQERGEGIGHATTDW